MTKHQNQTAGGDPRIDVNELLELGAATLHEAAGGTGALPSDIRQVTAGLPVAGPALPVRCAPGDNLALHEALAVAEAGHVIVAECGGAWEHGYFGEVMAVAAQARGVAGLIINGGVRDSDRLADLRFPAFAATRCIRGTTKDHHAPRSVGVPVSVGNTHVQLGDIVVADSDGVMVIPKSRAMVIINLAKERTEREHRQFAELQSGRLSLDVLGLRGEPT